MSGTVLYISDKYFSNV